MNLEELYSEMKQALEYFGLGWNSKDRVHVELGKGCILFVYEGRSIRVSSDG